MLQCYDESKKKQPKPFSLVCDKTNMTFRQLPPSILNAIVTCKNVVNLMHIDN